MSAPAFRVYCVTHHDGRLTGILMRKAESFFDGPPPSAYGETEEEVLAALAPRARALFASSPRERARYLWTEPFTTHTVKVKVHPQSTVKREVVVGARPITLKITYAQAPTPAGAWRIMLPRYGWWVLAESPEVVPEVLGQAVASALLAEDPQLLYDFRHEGREYVLPWQPDPASSGPRPRSGETVHYETVPQVADNLVHQAARHKLPTVIDAESIISPYRSMVLSDRPPSILLVGGPGVGKTTWVRALARLLMQTRRAADEDELTAELWATDADRLIAGMIYLGMWQARCLAIIEEMEHEGDYLYVGDLAALMTPRGGGSLAALFAPAVESGALPLIAECTPEALVRCRQQMPQFVEAFRIVRLSPPPSAQMPRLMGRYHQRKGKAASLEVHAAAWGRLVDHLERFQPYQCFPGKALRFLDWLHQTESRRTLYPADMSRLFARYTRLPAVLLDDDQTLGTAAIAEALKARVVGQDHACERAATVLARLKAGLNDPERPVGSLLFAGPTGVGKTETAKALAAWLFGDEQRLVRLDMSEFMVPGSAARLLQAGEGAESLAEKVRRQPLSVVLFDELEKAHPEVFDLLLGVLGEGRLTDASGRAVDFRMTVLVMTSNLGVKTQASPGFAGGGATAHDFVQAIRGHFRPEFFNRIDHVISFDPLDPEALRRIVDLELARAAKRAGLVRRNLTLKVSDAAKARLVELGYDPRRGARPLKRVIEARVMTPLAVRLAQTPDLRDQVIEIDHI